MKIHLLGVCGTFMAGIAIISRQKGYEVSGSDKDFYPPISDLLEQEKIEVISDYNVSKLKEEEIPDIFIVGNSMKRGMDNIEYILNNNLQYMSAPQFLYEYILKDRHVIAVSGTHGKTTTTSMLSWIIHQNQHDVGFLIGGVSENFCTSAKLGTSPFFVIEADEYDCAFFDKRSKFIHFKPKTLIINNIEFDHIDIFNSIEDIQKQFHNLIRSMASTAKIIYREEEVITETIKKGCWSEKIVINKDNWNKQDDSNDGTQNFCVFQGSEKKAEIKWDIIGDHNKENALSAIVAATAIGIDAQAAANSLTSFLLPKKRLEKIYDNNQMKIYFDFAHHPTAISQTIRSMKKVTKGNLIAILEPRSATMKSGFHTETLKEALNKADIRILYQPQNIKLSLKKYFQDQNTVITENIDEIPKQVKLFINKNDTVIIMSNGSFEQVDKKIIRELS